MFNVNLDIAIIVKIACNASVKFSILFNFINREVVDVSPLILLSYFLYLLFSLKISSKPLPTQND